MKLRYYTQNKNFTRNEIYKIEQEIYQKYFSQISIQCQREQSELTRLKYLMRRAKGENDKKQLMSRIQNLNLPNCELFQKLRQTLGI